MSAWDWIIIGIFGVLSAAALFWSAFGVFNGIGEAGGSILGRREK